MKTEYRLLETQNRDKLGELVTEFLSKNYKLYGNPFVYEYQQNNFDANCTEYFYYYCQAVIKTKKEIK
jgi:hypothetical protein